MKKYAGFLNIIAIAIVIIMGLLSAALVQMIVSSNNASTYTQAGGRADDLALAGVQTGIYQLKQNPAVCTGSYQSTQTIATGEYRYACLGYTGSSTLNGAISATASSLVVTNATSFAPFGYVAIDSEIMFYNGKSGNTLLGLRRGMQSTVAAIHSSLAAVSQDEYVVTGQGGSPTIATATGLRVINQAVIRATNNIYAADSVGRFYRYSGTAWTQIATLSPTNQINGISCIANDNCWAVGNSGKFHFYNGSIWTTTTVGSGNINSVSCSDSTHCVAVGASGTYVYNGTTWTGPSAPSTAFNAVSCVNSSYCWAGTNNNRFYFYNGSTWTLTTTMSQRIQAISCVDTTRCQAVGNNTYTFAYSGSLPWTQINQTASNTFVDISCPNNSYCVAPAGTRIFTYNGSTWANTTITPTITAVSCFDSSDCVAGGNNGQFYTFIGGVWTATQRPNTSSITAISRYVGSGAVITVLNTQS